MNEAAVKDQLRAWIARKHGKVSIDELTDTTPIVERRILSSLHLAELLVYVSELRGEPLDVEDLRPGAFRDVRTIYATFFTDGRGDR
jgi:acyl carrier protein